MDVCHEPSYSRSAIIAGGKRKMYRLEFGIIPTKFSVALMNAVAISLFPFIQTTFYICGGNIIYQ